MSSTSLAGTPITNLEPRKTVVVTRDPVGYSLTGGLGAAIFWFIIIAVITYLILYSTNPNFVRNSSGEPDPGKILLASVIIALIIVVIIWLIKSCSKMYC